jgi:CubicO group peptidase (beta-lactamase class C family)
LWSPTVPRCWAQKVHPPPTLDPEISASLDHDPTKVWSPVKWLAIAFAHPPNAPPGTTYEYNNTNYLLLSLVAEKVDRKPLAQSMQDRLFGPLRLQHTVFPALAVITLPEPFSYGYLYSCRNAGMLPWRRHFGCTVSSRHDSGRSLKSPESQCSSIGFQPVSCPHHRMAFSKLPPL